MDKQNVDELRKIEKLKGQCWRIIMHTTCDYLKTMWKIFSIKWRYIENINIYKETLKLLEWTN